eukprot:8589766-Pyramimonas_sp.AAC.1
MSASILPGGATADRGANTSAAARKVEAAGFRVCVRLQWGRASRTHLLWRAKPSPSQKCL